MSMSNKTNRDMYSDALAGDMNAGARPAKKTMSLKVTKKSSDGEQILEDTLKDEPVQSIAPMSRVTVSMGTTINLGNYESCKLDIGVSIPCAIGDEDATFEACSKFIETKSEQLLKQHGLENHRG